jgi:hypothetical protein
MAVRGFVEKTDVTVEERGFLDGLGPGVGMVSGGNLEIRHALAWGRGQDFWVGNILVLGFVQLVDVESCGAAKGAIPVGVGVCIGVGKLPAVADVGVECQS